MLDLDRYAFKPHHFLSKLRLLAKFLNDLVLIALEVVNLGSHRRQIVLGDGLLEHLGLVLLDDADDVGHVY